MSNVLLFSIFEVFYFILLSFFRSLIMMCFGADILSFTVFIDSVSLCLLAIWEVFYLCFFKYSSRPLSFSSHWDSNDKNVASHIIASPVPEDLGFVFCFFFFSLHSLCLVWMSYTVLSLNSKNVPGHLHFTVEPIYCILKYCLLYFFNSIVYILFLIITYVSFVTLSMSLAYFKRIHEYLLSIFRMSVLKSLWGNSNILLVSVLV